MKMKILIIATVLAWPLSRDAAAETAELRVRALRQARKVVRTSPPGESFVTRNTNFDGIWGGRYMYSPSSTCPTRYTSFNFRHLLVTRGSSGYLSTNHDSDFTGRSRDRGRRWEFVKSLTVGGRQAIMAVVYHSLARNGNSAGTAYGLSIRGACDGAFGGNAIRLAR